MKPATKEDLNDIIFQIREAFREKLQFYVKGILNLDKIIALKKYDHDKLIKYFFEVLEMINKSI